MFKNKRAGKDLKIGDKVIITNRSNFKYHYFKDGIIGEITGECNEDGIYTVKVFKNKNKNSLRQSIKKEHLILV